MEAIILAGGLGTRLAARLEGLPKPMAPVAGRPFLEILLTQLQRAGCTRVVLSVGHLHEAIERHFGVEFRGMRIGYAIERAPLGTGGAIRAALPSMKDKSVLVLNGDTFLDADYAAMLHIHGAAVPHPHPSMTIAVAHCADTARYGGVAIENGRVTGFKEKGRSGSGWINAGAYAIDRDIEWPAHLSEKFSFETDFLGPEIGRLAPSAFEVRGFFLDIGIPEDLDRAQAELIRFIG